MSWVYFTYAMSNKKYHCAYIMLSTYLKISWSDTCTTHRNFVCIQHTLIGRTIDITNMHLHAITLYIMWVWAIWTLVCMMTLIVQGSCLSGPTPLPFPRHCNMLRLKTMRWWIGHVRSPFTLRCTSSWLGRYSNYYARKLSHVPCIAAAFFALLFLRGASLVRREPPICILG